MNEKNKKSICIEVDGHFHFIDKTRNYSEEHKERIELLTNCGWKIFNTPYFYWYVKGIFNQNNPKALDEVMRIKEFINKNLF